MTRALVAVFRSQAIGLADRLHLSPAEVVAVSLRLAVDQAERAGITRADLESALADQLAVHAVEGDNGGGE